MEAGVLHDAPLAMKSRPLLILLAFCALVLALPRFHAQQEASETGVPEDLHLYLLIVNARGGTKIDEWDGKSELYREARKRTKAALNHGTLKGVLWHQGESDQGAADAYLGKLQTLVAKLRSDFNDPNLPFIAGQIHKPGAINDQIAKLPDEVRQKIYRGNAEKMYGLKRRSSLQVLGNKRAMTATPAPAVQRRSMRARRTDRGIRRGAGKERVVLTLRLRIFRIEIRREFPGRHLAEHSPGRNLRLGRPEDGVENDFALVVIAPVFVEMAAGEAEAAPAVRSIKGPGNGLRQPIGHRLADVRVAGMRAVRAFHGIFRRVGGENMAQLTFLRETHVEIPFVEYGVRFQAIADGVLGESLEIGDPMRVHAPVGFEVSAHPSEQLRATVILRDFHGIVQADQAAAAFHLLCKLLHPVALQQQVVAAAIAIDDDGVGGGELFWAGPFAVQDHGAFDRQAAFIEAFLEKE